MALAVAPWVGAPWRPPRSHGSRPRGTTAAKRAGRHRSPSDCPRRVGRGAVPVEMEESLLGRFSLGPRCNGRDTTALTLLNIP